MTGASAHAYHMDGPDIEQLMSWYEH